MGESEYLNRIADILIATFASTRSPRPFRQIVANRKFSRFQENSVQVALSRWHKKGLLVNSRKGWIMTDKGKAWVMKRQTPKYLNSPFEKKSIKNTVIAFDIPVRKSKLRDWLRQQLKIFNYEMLQQSLWFGPSPLPQEFLKRLEDLGIRENLKIFSVRKVR